MSVMVIKRSAYFQGTGRFVSWLSQQHSVCKHSYLVRSHHVVEPDHNRWKAMALDVALHDHLSSCFASGVWVCWVQCAGFYQIGCESFAIHLRRSALLPFPTLCASVHTSSVEMW
jgi:hypothetical protein